MAAIIILKPFLAWIETIFNVLYYLCTAISFFCEYLQKRCWLPTECDVPICSCLNCVHEALCLPCATPRFENNSSMSENSKVVGQVVTFVGLGILFIYIIVWAPFVAFVHRYAFSHHACILDIHEAAPHVAYSPPHIINTGRSNCVASCNPVAVHPFHRKHPCFAQVKRRLLGKMKEWNMGQAESDE